VRHVWGDQNIWTPGEIRHWLQHPRVQTRINAKITGEFPGDRFQYFLDRYMKDRLPVQLALTLGCGAGELERGLSKYHFARTHDGLDLSDHAVQLAQDAAAREGLSVLQYRVAELNTLQLDASTYDVVFGISAIHHVRKLEHLFEQVRNALTPGGYFFVDEYIGPTQFQWTEPQLRIMNEQLRKLPEELKRSMSEPGVFKTEVVRKSLEYMNAADPSEAVRSGDIVKLLTGYFNVVEFKGYGGSLLHELLYDIAGNFNERNPGSLERLDELFALEDELLANGTLSHDFAVIVARRMD
jgi:SAM-dependent methyltransferase